MCHATCCGTPEDMQRLINAGYGRRLMYDDLPGGEDMIKPALKGFEGNKSGWDVASKEGCTFWKDGKCELHDLGLKPSQGKLSHHSLTQEENNAIGNFVNESWDTEEGQKVIDEWKSINDYI